MPGDQKEAGKRKVFGEPHEVHFEKAVQEDFAGILLAWYRAHQRTMPWRSNPTPYKVWVSEIMLQQTRVDTVIPYFERFITALPDVQALAQAEEDTLLKLWEGLGYYSRVKNLKAAAKQVLKDHGGILPGTAAELQTLKGIGEYTAGAIASIAYGERVAAVDGNVLRVMARLLAEEGDLRTLAVQRRLKSAVEELLPHADMGDFTQALFELGALVCLPHGRPRCEACPVEDLCKARREGLAEVLPVKSKAKAKRVEERTVLLLLHEGRVALRRREEETLLKGLHELPNPLGHLTPEEVFGFLQKEGIRGKTLSVLPPSRFLFSHIEWRMQGYRVEVETPAGPYLWVTPAEIETTFSLAKAFKPYLEAL